MVESDVDSSVSELVHATVRKKGLGFVTRFASRGGYLGTTLALHAPWGLEMPDLL
jgi:hypothetical protein